MNYEPRSPVRIEDTKLDPVLLQQLVAKGMYLENLETSKQLAQEMKLPGPLIDSLLQDLNNRSMLESTGMADGGGAFGQLRYSMTRAGRDFAKDALEQNQYFGPAPVSLAVFSEQVRLQAIGEERVSPKDIEEAFHDIIVPDEFTRRLGPGVNSGKSILIYGPAGNGKTTVAEKVAKIYEAVVYIPYCIEVNGAIIKLFDPSVHEEVQVVDPAAERRAVIRSRSDARFVPCRRPVVITGGELNMEMLDLKFNAIAKFYEAPLHMKALNGTFIIDDFGRQLCTPEELLNRWIVPLQSRVDYLKLHSGKSFMIPFDELVIFSTNLSPDDLMDPAFLRRIPYKLETKDPSEEAFTAIYRAVAKGAGLELSDEIVQFTIREIVEVSGKTLAAYQPGFIMEQVRSMTKYLGVEMQLTQEFVAEALANLYVRESSHIGQVGTDEPSS